MNPLLQYLIQDPTYGYLYSHRLTMVAFGLRHDSQLRKYYPQLTLNADYLKLRGEDHVDRIFYTLSGLQKLVSFLQTPQATQFWTELTQYIQAQQPGAMVAQAPSPLMPQTSTVSGLSAPDYDLPPLPQWAPSEFERGPANLVPQSPSATPLTLEQEQSLAQFAAYLEPVIERAIASQWISTHHPLTRSNFNGRPQRLSSRAKGLPVMLLKKVQTPPPPPRATC